MDVVQLSRYRYRLFRLLKYYNREAAQYTEQVITTHKESLEDMMYEVICMYGAEPPPEDPYIRLQRFCHFHNLDKYESLESKLNKAQHSADDVEDYFSDLVREFGPEPEPPTPRSHRIHSSIFSNIQFLPTASNTTTPMKHTNNIHHSSLDYLPSAKSKDDTKGQRTNVRTPHPFVKETLPWDTPASHSGTFVHDVWQHNTLRHPDVMVSNCAEIATARKQYQNSVRNIVLKHHPLPLQNAVQAIPPEAPKSVKTPIADPPTKGGSMHPSFVEWNVEDDFKKLLQTESKNNPISLEAHPRWTSQPVQTFHGWYKDKPKQEYNIPGSERYYPPVDFAVRTYGRPVRPEYPKPKAPPEPCPYDYLLDVVDILNANIPPKESPLTHL